MGMNPGSPKFQFSWFYRNSSPDLIFPLFSLSHQEVELVHEKAPPPLSCLPLPPDIYHSDGEDIEKMGDQHDFAFNSASFLSCAKQDLCGNITHFSWGWHMPVWPDYSKWRNIDQILWNCREICSRSKHFMDFIGCWWLPSLQFDSQAGLSTFFMQ